MGRVGTFMRGLKGGFDAGVVGGEDGVALCAAADWPRALSAGVSPAPISVVGSAAPRCPADGDAFPKGAGAEVVGAEAGGVLGVGVRTPSSGISIDRTPGTS